MDSTSTSFIHINKNQIKDIPPEELENLLNQTARFYNEFVHELNHEDLTEEEMTKYKLALAKRLEDDTVSIELALNAETHEYVGVGVCKYDDRAKAYEYTLAYVQPAFRRKGIFGQLTDEVLKRTQEWGKSEDLRIFADRNIEEFLQHEKGFSPPDSNEFMHVSFSGEMKG